MACKLRNRGLIGSPVETEAAGLGRSAGQLATGFVGQAAGGVQGKWNFEMFLSL